MMNTLSRIDTKNQRTHIERERELLLRCLHTEPNDSTIEHIKALVQEDIDWEYLIQTAYKHGVLPIFYWSLSRICPQSIPAPFRQQLQSHQYATTQRNLILTSKLLKLLDLFEANNIPVIPFKGPMLAMLAYGDISRRYFCDLDILVRRQDFLKTKELLTTQGYRPYSNSSEEEAAYLSSLNEQQQKAYLQSHWELHLVDERDRVTVDLHHGMLPKQFSFLFDTEWIWEEAQLKPFAHKMVLNFTLEDLILILCSQGAKDCWLQMNRICDIAQVIRTSDQIDWEKMCERADQLRMTRILLLGLLLTHNLLEIELPNIILQQIEANRFLESIASQIDSQLFSQTDNSLQNYKVKKFFFHLQLIEYPLDKLWYFFEDIIVPTVADQVFLPLPKYLYLLYYFIRPVRLITMYLLPLLAGKSR